MKRVIDNKLEQELIDAMYKFHSLLKDGFMSQSKINMKVDIPKFIYSDLNHHKEMCIRDSVRCGELFLPFRF